MASMAQDITSVWGHDVTKPFKFIGFGAIDVTKPYKLIGFGVMDITKPYKSTGFGAMDVYSRPRFSGRSRARESRCVEIPAFRPEARARERPENSGQKNRSVNK